MAHRMSWAKGSKTSLYGPRTFELRKSGRVLAVVQECSGGWFSYGMGDTFWNTSHAPMSLDNAKADALRRARETTPSQATTPHNTA